MGMFRALLMKQSNAVYHTVTAHVGDTQQQLQVREGALLLNALNNIQPTSGYEITGWKDADNNEITSTTKVTESIAVYATQEEISGIGTMTIGTTFIVK